MAPFWLSKAHQNRVENRCGFWCRLEPVLDTIWGGFWEGKRRFLGCFCCDFFVLNGKPWKLQNSFACSTGRPFKALGRSENQRKFIEKFTKNWSPTWGASWHRFFMDFDGFWRPCWHRRCHENRLKTILKSERIFEGFWKPFGSRRGPVLGGQTPPNSIIPEVPFSKLFPILIRKASRVGFWEIFGEVGEDFEAFLVLFFLHFDHRFC